MRTSFFLIQKNWTKHKKDLLALMFSSVLMTSIILVFWLMHRETNNRFFCENLYSGGTAELTVFNSDDELADFITNNGNVKTAHAYMYGEFGDEQKFAYGTIDDPHDIIRIPFESGRMPSGENEIAVDRAVLDRLFWAGKCGDTITFDEKTYTVVGIFDISKRCGSSLSQEPPYCMLDGKTMENCAVLPLILMEKPDGKPQGRIDCFTGIVDKRLTTEQAEKSESFTRIYDYLMENLDHEQSCFSWNFIGSGTIGDNYSTLKNSVGESYSLLFLAGAAVAVLSVFTVLRTVFRERTEKASILKRLGMSRKKRAEMYALECFALTIFQTIAGFIVGSAAYEIVLLFKTIFLNEKYISGFTGDIYVTSRSFPPFLISGIISCTVMITAYILNLLTIRSSKKAPSKNSKPCSLNRSFGKVFRGGLTTVVQAICLVIICASVTLCYMSASPAGKYKQSIMLGAPSEKLTAGGIDMGKADVAEYYFCQRPNFGGITTIDDFAHGFYSAAADYSLGIDDDIAKKLPEYSYAAGVLQQPFIIGDNSNQRLENKIDFSNENVRQLLLKCSSEEYQNFFDEGQIGSKSLYRAITCLADEKVLKMLSEYVHDVEINIEALNNGSEILVVSCSRMPPFKAGESYTFGSASSGETGYGISEMTVTNPVKIGAVIRLPDSADILTRRLVSTEEKYCSYNFLTTAKGAKVMGLGGARYTEIFSKEAMNGSLLPSSAQMQLTSINQLKQDAFLKRLRSNAWIITVLLVMSLLGFSAYFNGIGMKIRQRSYEISVLRAVGMPIKRIRRVWLFQGLRVPLFSSIIAYIFLKIAQTSANSLADKWDELWQAKDKFVRDLSETVFMKNNWWQANLEIPVIVLWLIFSAVTALLTLAAMKKFGGNIAGNLSEGRTRQ